MQSAHVVPAATRTPIGRFCPLRAQASNLVLLSPRGRTPSPRGQAMRERAGRRRPCP